jgi:hypothetical protein
MRQSYNAPQSAIWLQTPPAALMRSPLPPWIEPPGDHEAFDFMEAIDTPVVGVEATVFSFRVPTGWAGVIYELTHVVEGPALTQGSGDLEWSLKLDRLFIQNYGALRVSFGSIEQPRTCFAIRIKPGQTFYYIVKNNNYLPLGTRTICGAKGWFYPEVVQS